jgi:hypothetical protein
MKIGEAHRNVRSTSSVNFLRSVANRRCKTCYMIPRVPQCLSPCIGTPLLQVCPPLAPKGGHTHLWVKGLGGPNSDDWRKSLAYSIILILILLAQGTSECQYIGVGGPRCANILAHRCPPPPIGNADQAQCANNIFFLISLPLLLAQGASVRQ